MNVVVGDNHGELTGQERCGYHVIKMTSGGPGRGEREFRG